MIFRLVAVYFLLCGYLFSFEIEVDVLSDSHYKAGFLLASVVEEEFADYHARIQERINFNLSSSGVFAVQVMQESIPSVSLDLDVLTETFGFVNYDGAGIVKLFYDPSGSNYIIEAYLYDNLQGDFVGKFGYKIPENRIESMVAVVANDISNIIYTNFTNRPGYFNSLLAYVTANKLMISAYDGSNAFALLESEGKIYGPEFSKDNQYVAYVDFIDGLSSVYIYNFKTRDKIKLGDFTGLSLSPRFSNNGKELVFGLSNGGSANIVKVDLATKAVRNLTSSYSINLPGGYSENDQYIIFNSDRIGAPAIYLMNKDGNEVRKISSRGGSYYNPSFSPYDSVILFTKIGSKSFEIGLMDLEGGEKIIALDPYVEGPAWLPDGRHIIYQHVYKRVRGEDIYGFYIMDIFSGALLRIVAPDSIMDPNVSNNVELNIRYDIK